MSQQERYNGYANRPTWAVCLWLSNDEHTYNWVQELISESADDYEAAQALRDALEENNPLQEASSLYSDLLGWALALVDYGEVVEHLKPGQ